MNLQLHAVRFASGNTNNKHCYLLISYTIRNPKIYICRVNHGHEGPLAAWEHILNTVHGRDGALRQRGSPTRRGKRLV
jgi:hypothetical protein